jgi:hypothetical protein
MADPKTILALAGVHLPDELAEDAEATRLFDKVTACFEAASTARSEANALHEQFMEKAAVARKQGYQFGELYEEFIKLLDEKAPGARQEKAKILGKDADEQAEKFEKETLEQQVAYAALQEDFEESTNNIMRDFGQFMSAEARNMIMGAAGGMMGGMGGGMMGAAGGGMMGGMMGKVGGAFGETRGAMPNMGNAMPGLPDAPLPPRKKHRKKK